jgi:hypothetical protein
MKVLATALLLLGVTILSEPNPAFFRYTRDIHIEAPARQNYFVVDSAIWQHARSDLADLRLYDGSVQVPYMLTAEQAVNSSQQREAKIFNLGVVRGEIEFDLDMRDLPEYDRVTLRLSAKNFVATAHVEGMQELGRKPSAQLGTSTVYDFSRENLGSSSVVRFPTATFPYLHIRLGPGITPNAVLGASIANVRESKARWRVTGTCAGPKQAGRATEISCRPDPGVPVGRIQFDVPPDRINFQRRVLVLDAKDKPVAGGTISRIRINRGSTQVSSEELFLNVSSAPAPGTITIKIDNGDDPPLAFASVVLQTLERRVYFDPRGSRALKLYYGAAKLEPPVYDYAKFFRQEENSSEARLEPETLNAAYAGRPDDRPWSERHKSVLWIAMLIAVAILSGLAIRGLRSSGSSPRNDPPAG